MVIPVLSIVSSPDVTAATFWSCWGWGGGGWGRGCLKHTGGMQTHKPNNLLQDQSLWLERCVTLYYTGIITMNSLVCQDMISVWTPHTHIDVLEFFFFLFLFIAPPPPLLPPPVTDMNPSLFLIQEVKGWGRGLQISPKKATCVLLIFNFAETATLQGGGKIFKTMFCFSWEDRRAN